LPTFPESAPNGGKGLPPYELRPPCLKAEWVGNPLPTFPESASNGGKGLPTYELGIGVQWFRALAGNSHFLFFFRER